MFSGIINQVASSVLGDKANAIKLVKGLIDSQGGISNVLAKFNAGGLGDIVSSWLGSGENKEISADNVDQIFGKDEIEKVAQQNDVEPSGASNLVAQFLPKIVDMISPNGSADEKSLGGGVEDLLKFFK